MTPTARMARKASAWLAASIGQFQRGSGRERGDRADLLEELERVELVPVLGEQAVADAPDVDRVHFDLSAAGGHAEERSGVPAAIRVAANDGGAGVDDVVDVDLEVVKGGEEGTEDRDGSGLARFCVSVVVDVVGMKQRGEVVEVGGGEGLGEALGETGG